MTIEQANAAAVAASTAGDLDALEQALSDRAEAIRELLESPPSEELASRLRSAIGAGEFIERDLRALQGRIAQLRSGLAAGYASDPAIDIVG